MDEQSPGHRGSHTMQKASKPKSSTPRQRGGKSAQTSKKSKKSTQRTGSAPRNLGAAVYQPAKRVGMSDLMAHEISYLAGYVYVGNGTLGATDSVYYQNVAKDRLALPDGASTGGTSVHVPVLPTNAFVGASYIQDVEKHFARKRIRTARVELHSLQPATSNSMVVQVSPVRGAGNSPDTSMATGTAAGATLAGTLAMDGSRSCTSWESTSIDLTPFIAGGSGAKQNEFNNDAPDDGGGWGVTSSPSLNQIAPCALVVSGQNNTAALRGTQTHMIVIRLCLDYLDFIGSGVTGIYPAPRAAVDLRALMKHILCSEGPGGIDRIVRHVESEDPKLALRLRSLVSGVHC